MTQSDKEELVTALQMRICFIETGDPILRATDVHNQLRTASNSDQRARLSAKLKPLGTPTMKLILQLEGLIETISKAKVTE